MKAIDTIANSTLIGASLEAVALSGEDIVPHFFGSFFRAFPEQRDLFQRPQATQGKMVNEMISLIQGVAANLEWVDEVMVDCVARHHRYGNLTVSQFRIAIDILIETLATIASSGWRTEFSHAWSTVVDQMIRRLSYI